MINDLVLLFGIIFYSNLYFIRKMFYFILILYFISFLIFFYLHLLLIFIILFFANLNNFTKCNGGLTVFDFL